MEPISFTPSQEFELEKWKRIIDETKSVEDLRRIAKEFLKAWQVQRAGTRWVINQHMSNPHVVDQELSKLDNMGKA